MLGSGGQGVPPSSDFTLSRDREMAVRSSVLQAWGLGTGDRPSDQLCLVPACPLLTILLPPCLSLLLGLLVHVVPGRYGNQLSRTVSSWTYLIFLNNSKLALHHPFYTSVSPLALFSYPSYFSLLSPEAHPLSLHVLVGDPR